MDVITNLGSRLHTILAYGVTTEILREPDRNDMEKVVETEEWIYAELEQI